MAPGAQNVPKMARKIVPYRIFLWPDGLTYLPLSGTVFPAWNPLGKQAEFLLAHLESVVQEVERVWQSMVVAVVTDASGECQKAQRLFLQKYPWIVVLDCYSHQVSHSHHF